MEVPREIYGHINEAKACKTKESRDRPIRPPVGAPCGHLAMNTRKNHASPDVFCPHLLVKSLRYLRKIRTFGQKTWQKNENNVYLSQKRTLVLVVEIAQRVP